MKIIGHRGARGLAPENSIASFKAALDNKVNAIELDIQTTADDELAVIHDPKIGGLMIYQTGFEKLKRIKPDLITLQEALEYINKRCPIIVEIKKGSNIDIVVRKMKKLNLPENLQIVSFHMPYLKAIKENFPGIDIIVNEKWSGVRASYRCRKLDTKYVQMNERWLWGGFIKAVNKSGYRLTAYTLNNPAKARRFEKYGLYGCITDFPDRF